MAEIRPIISTVGTPNASLVESNSSVIGRTGAELMREGTAQMKEGLDFIQAERERAERARVAAETATAKAEFTAREQHLAKTADPNEYPDLAEQLLNDYNQRLVEIGGNIKTRANADAYTAMSAVARGEMSVQVMAEMTEKAGQAQQANFVTAGNALTASTRSNPSLFANNQIALENLIEETLPSLDPQVKETLRQNALKGNAQSYIQGISANGNFDRAREILDSGELDKYIDGGDKDALYRRIDTDENSWLADQKAAITAQEDAQKRELGTQLGSIMGSLEYGADGRTTIVPPGAFAALDRLQEQFPGVDDAEIRAVRGALTTALDTAASGLKPFRDGAIYNDFANRMSDNLTKTEVYEAFSQGYITREDMTFFEKAVNDRLDVNSPENSQNTRFNGLVKTWESTISNSIFGANADAIGDQMLGYFKAEAREMFDRLSAAGASDNDILNALAPLVEKYAPNGQARQKYLMDSVSLGYQPTALPNPRNTTQAQDLVAPPPIPAPLGADRQNSLDDFMRSLQPPQ